MDQAIETIQALVGRSLGLLVILEGGMIEASESRRAGVG